MKEAKSYQTHLFERLIDQLDHMLGTLGPTLPHGGTIQRKAERLVEAYQDHLAATQPSLYILQRVAFSVL